MTLSSKAHTLCVHVVQCSHNIAYSKLLHKLHSSQRNNFSMNRNYSAQLESGQLSEPPSICEGVAMVGLDVYSVHRHSLFRLVRVLYVQWLHTTVKEKFVMALHHVGMFPNYLFDAILCKRQYHVCTSVSILTNAPSVQSNAHFYTTSSIHNCSKLLYVCNKTDRSMCMTCGLKVPIAPKYMYI